MSRTTGVLRLACLDAEAPPLFHKAAPDGSRRGYEPAAAALVATELGRTLEWACVPWNDMIPSAQRHEVDAVWCGQGITASRLEQVDFTRPYAVFDESVLVRRGAGSPGPRTWPACGSQRSPAARTWRWRRPSPAR